MKESKAFDYIIVGAGSAGCVLANRLSQGGEASLLLLEAGGADRHPLVHVPIRLGKLHQRRIYNWGLTAESDPALHGRVIRVPRGKVLGGSHSINVMAHSVTISNRYQDLAARFAQKMLFDDLKIAFHRGLDTRHEFLLLRRDRSIRQSSNGRFWRTAAVRTQTASRA
jgi:4-pyridoxate dehydrogenase